MKINEVEQRVGITKKNIRFYEDKQLITPSRVAENGYRDYSMEDVETLLKIKLLRRLNISIEEIRKLQNDEITFSECMENHQRFLKNEQKNLEVMSEICTELSANELSVDSIKAEDYLEEIERLEKGGTVFVNVLMEDQKKQKIAPWIAACSMVFMMAAVIGVLVWAETVDPMPILLFLFIIIIPAVVIVGVFIALYLRLKEIEGGEIYEAAKY